MVKVISAVFLLLIVFTADVNAQVVINEISSASDPEWVELVNSGGSDYNLDGCTLYLDDNHDIQKIVFGSEVIGAGGIKVVERGNLGWSSNWLNNSGDQVSIICSDNSSVVAYGSQSGSIVDAPESDTTAAKVPGSSDWNICSPTKNGINTTCVLNTPTPTATPQPTNTSTPTNSPTNTSTPTKKPTSTPTKKPSPTPTKKMIANTSGVPDNPRLGNDGTINEASMADGNSVLGINEEISIEDFKDKEGVTAGGKIPLTAGVFIAGGLVLVVGAVYPTMKTKLIAWGAKGDAA